MKKQYKISILIFIGLILMYSFYYFIKKNNNENNNTKINIGAVLPLTGKIAEYGNYWKEGMELALYDAKQKKITNSEKVNLIFEDGVGNPSKSVNAFSKLINANNVQVCFSATSGVTLAMKPIANENKIVLMNASAISTKIEDKPDYVFSVIPNASYTGKFLADAAYNTLNKRNAGILYRNDASGISFKDEFKKQFIKDKGKIVYESAHNLNNTDFKSYILEIKKIKDIDVLFVASWGPEVAYFAKQAKENGLNIQVIAYETFKSPKVLDIAGSAANGVIFSSPKLIEIEEPELYEQYKKKVEKLFGSKEINYHILGHYDATMILLNAISKGNYTGTQIKNYLAKMQEYNGITGKIKFDNNGAVNLPLGLYSVKNNKFIKY